MVTRITAPENIESRLRCLVAEVRNDTGRITTLRDLATQVEKLAEAVETLLNKTD